MQNRELGLISRKIFLASHRVIWKTFVLGVEGTDNSQNTSELFFLICFIPLIYPKAWTRLVYTLFESIAMSLCPVVKKGFMFSGSPRKTASQDAAEPHRAGTSSAGLCLGSELCIEHSFFPCSLETTLITSGECSRLWSLTWSNAHKSLSFCVGLTELEAYSKSDLKWLKRKISFLLPSLVPDQWPVL